MPDLTLRTTFIVGFPGETEIQFKKLLDFMEEVEFERLGIFNYSREEFTRSYDFDHQVPDEIGLERRHRAMLLQQKISKKKNSQKIGKVIRVICDQRSFEDDNICEARAYSDAPEVDGLVIFEDRKKSVRPGDMINIQISGYTEYDLIGKIVN